MGTRGGRKRRGLRQNGARHKAASRIEHKATSGKASNRQIKETERQKGGEEEEERRRGRGRGGGYNTG